MTKTKSTKDTKKPANADKQAPPDGGWRETVESVAMAVILALLFRGFVAEAFVIPTGSMAPTLDGRHKDLKCPQCGERYQVSCSPEQEYDVLTGRHVVNGTCPVCRYTQRLNPRQHPNEGSFSGDRIIVAKFAYDLTEPKRWDVIVFKFPGGAATNYIKRLIGLPGEKVFVMGGNIYTCDKDEPNEPDGSPPQAARIARKPPAKLNALLQIVDDTDHIPPELTKLAWPTRWQNLPAAGNDVAAWKALDGGRAFTIDGSGESDAWLRYRTSFPATTTGVKSRSMTPCRPVWPNVPASWSRTSTRTTRLRASRRSIARWCPSGSGRCPRPIAHPLKCRSADRSAIRRLPLCWASTGWMIWRSN